MIPKIIHYCWVGNGKISETEARCMESWKKYCPDYEIIRWDESKIDIGECNFLKEAYDSEKWAFVSDFVRLKALCEYGGIYLDTDVELCSSLDNFLNDDAFLGFEIKDGIGTGIMACNKNNAFMRELLKDYYNKKFINEDNTLNVTPNTHLVTKKIREKGGVIDNTFQVIDGITLYPSDYFSPKEYTTGRIYMTKNTVAIHHFSGSWLGDKSKYNISLIRKLSSIMPERIASRVSIMIATVKFDGIRRTIQDILFALRKH